MNGPQHYKAAEDLAHDARLILERQTPNTAAEANTGAAALATLAQVHATLALAAATAFASAGMPADGMHALEWRRTVDPKPVITNHPEPPPSNEYECCASGSCEVCRA